MAKKDTANCIKKVSLYLALAIFIVNVIVAVSLIWIDIAQFASATYWKFIMTSLILFVLCISIVIFINFLVEDVEQKKDKYIN